MTKPDRNPDPARKRFEAATANHVPGEGHVIDPIPPDPADPEDLAPGWAKEGKDAPPGWAKRDDTFAEEN